MRRAEDTLVTFEQRSQDRDTGHQ